MSSNAYPPCLNLRPLASRLGMVYPGKSSEIEAPLSRPPKKSPLPLLVGL